jgi:hypothetical protein
MTPCSIDNKTGFKFEFVPEPVVVFIGVNNQQLIKRRLFPFWIKRRFLINKIKNKMFKSTKVVVQNLIGWRNIKTNQSIYRLSLKQANPGNINKSIRRCN